MMTDHTDTIDDETNMADVNTAILVATQSWKEEPIPAATKPGERRILWPLQGSSVEAGWGQW